MHRAGAIAVALLLPLLALVFLLGAQRARAGQASGVQATLCVKPGGGDGCSAAINEALAAAAEGDTIRVAAGTYTENVVVSKTVTLEGGWNSDFTVRDPHIYSATVRPADETQTVVSVEDADPTVDGFIITGGRAHLAGNHGGGLRLIDSEALVRHNVIVSNSAYLLGGGVWVQGGAPTLENNRIEDNLSLGPGQDAFGGGLQLENSRATLVNNLIAGNVVSGTGAFGGGVDVLGAPLHMEGNTIAGNRALAVEMGVGGGVAIDGGGTFTLTANVIAGNRITTTNGPALADVHAGGGGVGLRGSGELLMADNVIRTNSISATANFGPLAYGGGVFVSGGGLLAMSGDRVESNRALDSEDDSSLGGGIYVQDGQTVLNAVTVRDNEAVAGGGVLATEDLEMNDSTVAGNRADYGGGVYVWYPNTNGSAVVRGSVISGNHATRGGGLFQFAGSLAVRDSTVISNVVEELEGGGLYTAYSLATDVLTVMGSTIADNRAPIGAGVYSNVALHLETTTVRHNAAADFGGGLTTRRAATVVDSAIVENEADGYGAALSHVSTDTMTLENVTISGNSSTSTGAVYFDGDAALANVTITDNGPAGIYRQSGNVTLVNTILAANNGPNCSQPLTSLGHNLEDADTCGLDPAMDDLPNTDPLLGPLQDNGGPTLTHALLAGSPAVDAGENGSCLDKDQRGRPRVDGDFEGTISCDVGAYELLSSFVVNSTEDEVDADPGDGLCETAPDNETCTLRAAILEANALGGVELIDVPAGAYTLTRENPPPAAAAPGPAAEDFSETGDLDIYVDGIIEGAGAASTIIDGNGLDRVLHVLPDTSERGPYTPTVQVGDVTIRGGSTADENGGGIYNDGYLTLLDSVVSGNVASDAPDNARAGGGIYNNRWLSLVNVTVEENVSDDGGGLFNEGGSQTTITGTAFTNNTATQSAGGINHNGALTVTNSLFYNNTATQFNGGGIFNNAGIVLRNVTLSSNEAEGNGGGIFNNTGVMTVTNATIYGNEAALQGDGLYNDEVMTLENSIVAGNGDENCADNDTLVSAGHNLEDADTCAFNPAKGDLVGVDPLLEPLADNGGSTPTHALSEGSPAIDSGNDDACPSADQRGVLRPVDGDEDGAAVCDIGAFEFRPAPTLYLPVSIRQSAQ